MFVEPTLEMAIGKKVDVSFEHEGRTFEFSMVVEELEMRNDPFIDSYRDFGGRIVYTHVTPDYHASFSGRVVPSERFGKECLIAERHSEHVL
jgi:hypothetical protein